MRHVILILLFWSLTATLSVGGHAHSFGRSSSDWRISEGGYSVYWSMSRSEFNQLISAADGAGVPQGDITTLIGRWLRVESGGEICPIEIVSAPETPITPGGQAKPAGAATDIEIGFMVACAAETVTFEGLFAGAPSHVHFAAITTLAGERRALATVDKPGFLLAPQASQSEAGLWTYVTLGFSHILEGYDHLAFVMALILIVSQIRPLFWAITGFTLGHSVTLALGSLGLVAARPEIVEPVIAFTIAFTAMDGIIARSREAGRWFIAGVFAIILLLALELSTVALFAPVLWLGLGLMSICVWAFSLQGEERARKILPLVTVGFGLIHGFGFAGVLSELGLPSEGRFEALLGFNLGVELGQIAFVLVLMVGASFGRFLRPESIKRVRHLIALALIGLGLYWFVERVFGWGF